MHVLERNGELRIVSADDVAGKKLVLAVFVEEGGVFYPSKYESCETTTR
jgi:hypothetical protein